MDVCQCAWWANHPHLIEQAEVQREPLEATLAVNDNLATGVCKQNGKSLLHRAPLPRRP